MSPNLICAAVFWVVLFVQLSGVDGTTVDCSTEYINDGYSLYCPVINDFGSNYPNYDHVYCGAGLTCCDNGCCYTESGADRYRVGEIAGLVLCGSALAVTGFLTLVICGATYCNDKDDKTSWQKD